MRFYALLATAGLLSICVGARADSISFTESDIIYGPQSGSVSNVTGSADILYFNAAVAGTYETIDITNAAGIVTDTIFSPSGMSNIFGYAGDAFEFAGSASGNPAIGTQCVASSTVACVVNTGGSIDLSSEVDSQSIGHIFSGASGSLIVTAQVPGATPEPSSLALLGTGLLGAVAILRRRLA